MQSVLRIQDVYPGSRIQGQKDSFIPDPYKVFLTQKTVSELSEKWFGMFIPDPESSFFPSRIRIPDAEVKKSLDSGSQMLKTAEQ